MFNDDAESLFISVCRYEINYSLVWGSSFLENFTISRIVALIFLTKISSETELSAMGNSLYDNLKF